MNPPLCIDLFCGYGGWARGFLDAGFRVIGFDNERRCATRYPGEFIVADVRTLSGGKFHRAKIIVASPPCNRFTTVATRTRDPEEGLILVRHAMRIIKEANPEYWVIENVRGAFTAINRELGMRPLNAPLHKNGSCYLWGTIPSGAILPRIVKGWRRDRNAPPSMWTGSKQAPHRDSRMNSRIAYPLARALAEACI